MAASLFSRFYHLFHRRIGLTETDIVCDRVMKEINILEHKAEIFHKAVHAVCAHIFAVKRYAALINVPEA